MESSSERVPGSTVLRGGKYPAVRRGYALVLLHVVLPLRVSSGKKLRFRRKRRFPPIRSMKSPPASRHELRCLFVCAANSPALSFVIRNWWILAKTLLRIVRQDPLEMICSTGKRQSWDPKIHLMPGEFYSWISTFPPIILSR